MKVLVACEYSGTVRDAFSKRGWDAWSNDLISSESEMTNDEGKHLMGDIYRILEETAGEWDLMIAHPPCTYLTVSGNRHIPSNPERWRQRFDALNFVWGLWTANVPHIAIENPIGVLSSYIRKPDQIIQPYYWGDPIPKSTCLWLKDLPCLTWDETTLVEPEYIEYNSKKNKSGKSKYSVFGKLGKGKGHERSKFFEGMANAMADQWTEYLKKGK